VILTPRSLGMSEGHGKIEFKQPKTKSNISTNNTKNKVAIENKIDN